MPEALVFGLANARRNLMKFLFLGVMSDESVSNMHTTSFDKRKAMADIVANGAGGSLIDMCFVQGIYDMVAIMDLPSNSAAIGAKAAVLASGAYDHVEILNEFDLDIAGQVKSAISQSYRPVGEE
jgi:uncharacterized protein with GYD domain